VHGVNGPFLELAAPSQQVLMVVVVVGGEEEEGEEEASIAAAVVAADTGLRPGTGGPLAAAAGVGETTATMRSQQARFRYPESEVPVQCRWARPGCLEVGRFSVCYT